MSPAAWCFRPVLMILGLLFLAGLRTKRLKPVRDAFSQHHKPFVAVCRCLLAAYVLAPEAVEQLGYYVGPLQEQRLVYPRLILVIAWLFWEAGGYLSDEMNARSFKDLDQLLREADDRGAWIAAVAEMLRGNQAERNEALRRSIDEQRVGRVNHVRKALEPDRHVRVILERVAILLTSWRGTPSETHVRLGFYVDQDGTLVPVVGYDSRTRSAAPFTSPFDPQFRECFKVDGAAETPAFVVRCVREGRMLIASDCGDPTRFAYYRSQQREYLKSMVAYPLRGFLSFGRRCGGRSLGNRCRPG